MKLVIPENQQSLDSWDCCFLFYPADAKWKGHVIGALQQLARPYNWDERTGDIFQAARIGQLIVRSLDPSDALLESDVELQQVMACLQNLVSEVARVADALEAANQQPQLDLSALDNLSELEGLLQLVQIAASLDPEMALLVSATQEVAGYLGGGTG